MLTAAAWGEGSGGEAVRRLGPRGLGFCLAPLPLAVEWGDRLEGGTAASRVSDPHALPP